MATTIEELADQINSLTTDELQQLETQHGIIISLAQASGTGSGDPTQPVIGPGH